MSASIALGTHSKGELLERTVIPFRFLRSRCTSFHSADTAFVTFPPTVQKGSNFYTSCPTLSLLFFLFVYFLEVAILRGVRCYLTGFFLSLVISIVEHLSMYLLATPMSSLEMSTQVFTLGCLIFVGQMPPYLFPGRRAS